MLKMNYDFPEAEGLVLCGDIHGKFDELVYRMTKLCRMEHTVVIVAGSHPRRLLAAGTALYRRVGTGTAAP